MLHMRPSSVNCEFLGKNVGVREGEQAHAGGDPESGLARLPRSHTKAQF